jgi:hypothetical protein
VAMELDRKGLDVLDRRISVGAFALLGTQS